MNFPSILIQGANVLFPAGTNEPSVILENGMIREIGDKLNG